jgi:hypothetical protein
MNISRFLRSEFHDDSGVKSLVEAFYRSVVGEAELPISYAEILRTSVIMDEIFAQLFDAPARRPDLAQLTTSRSGRAGS